MCNETEEVCESGYKLFNTNLVFDRNGCLISHYRKFNLFVEPFMNVTSTPDIATFETDFDVIFGHFICFDLLFQSPALDLIKMGINHILYPSMWFSETPFLSSAQVQQSFAQRNNVVLLSAGTNSPSNSNTGSGIFIGRHGAVDKIVSWRNESRMLIAEVPKNVDDPDYEPPLPSVEPYKPNEMEELNLWRFTPKNVFPLVDHYKYSMNNITCEFFINYTSVADTENCYKLTAFSGVRSYGGIVDGGEVHCAIVPEIEKDELFEPCVEFHEVHIKLSVHGSPDDYLVMPTSLDTSIHPLGTQQYIFEYDIEDENQKYSMRATQEFNNLMTFGIYGRHFSLDKKLTESDALHETEDNPENPISISGTHVEKQTNNLGFKMTVYVVFMVVLGIITTIMVRRKLRTPYVRPDFNKRKS